MEVQLRVGKFFVRNKQKLDITGELAVFTWRRAWKPTPVFLPGESPWTEKPGGVWSIASQRIRHDCATKCYCTRKEHQISLCSLKQIQNPYHSMQNYALQIFFQEVSLQNIMHLQISSAYIISGYLFMSTVPNLRQSLERVPGSFSLCSWPSGLGQDIFSANVFRLRSPLAQEFSPGS